MLDRLEKAIQEKTGLFSSVLPVPTELVNTTAPNHDGSNAKALMEKYGATDWYDWSVKNWGTKWDVEPDGYTRPNPNTLSVAFETAWGPALQFYEHLETLGFTVEAMYYEPGMAFAGIYTDGVHDAYNLVDMNSSEVAELLPTVLDEAFCISECMAEYEDENQG
jgi:hypothetical protein